MNWRNAVVGAIVGWVILRHPMGIPVGALVGYFLGPSWGDERPKPKPARMLWPLFGLAGALCKADGRISDAEVREAEQWMDRLGLDRRKRKQAIAAFDAGKQANFDFEAHGRELAAHCVVRLDLKIMLLGALHQIAAADGAMHPLAARMHQQLMDWFEVPIDLWQQAQGKFGAEPDAAPLSATAASVSDYHVLGISKGASDEEVRRAYRKLLAKHHPDKLSGRVVSQQDKQLAEERTRKIIAAYERIKNTRNMR